MDLLQSIISQIFILPNPPHLPPEFLQSDSGGWDVSLGSLQIDLLATDVGSEVEILAEERGEASARRDQVNGNGDGQSYANHRLLRQAALTKIKSTASEEAPIKLDRHPLTTDELNHARSGDCSSKEPVGVASPRRGRETTAPEYGDAAVLRKTRTREESEND
uniref:Uncharacterized protein n=1 Tax=Oryza barthii TaxID=65489 RepID=A0A0D3FMK8_9ORYZ